MKRWNPTRLSATQPEVRRPGPRVAMYVAAAAACLSLAAFAAPGARAVAPPASGCAAVNLIVARASTEAPGEGITQSLATEIVNSSTQTVSQQAVVYPATLTNYASSESLGVTDAEQELTTAVNNCPNQKEVLLGYSQGAEVSMDVIAGNSEVGGTMTPVSTAISSHVVAIANFGDPGHVVGEPWDLGTATHNGLFPRSSAQLRSLAAFGGSSKIAAWCDSNDPYCADGANLTVHLTYLNRYQGAAASFVLSKIGG
jgi:acetylxylan esterase